MILSAHGLTIDVPRGWDARIFRRTESIARSPHIDDLHDVAPLSGETAPVLHLANFALPDGRGDYGSGAVERMRSGHVFAALVEFAPEVADTALFREGPLPPIRGRDISSSTMQRPISGLGGAQYFFTTKGRAFCLYAVVGAVSRRSNLASMLSRATGKITIS